MKIHEINQYLNSKAKKVSHVIFSLHNALAIIDHTIKGGHSLFILSRTKSTNDLHLVDPIIIANPDTKKKKDTPCTPPVAILLSTTSHKSQEWAFVINNTPIHLIISKEIFLSFTFSILNTDIINNTNLSLSVDSLKQILLKIEVSYLFPII